MYAILVALFLSCQCRVSATEQSVTVTVRKKEHRWWWGRNIGTARVTVGVSVLVHQSQIQIPDTPAAAP